MELVELLRMVVEKVSPLVEKHWTGKESHDPDGDLEKLVECARRVLDAGLLIGRGL